MPETSVRINFDPVEVGRQEAIAWASYYRHDWWKFLRAAIGMVNSGFQMGPRKTLAGAWHVLKANQEWAPYPDNNPDAARGHMERFYRLVASSGHWFIDPVRAATLEVEWWRVHRMHQHADDLREEDLTDSLVALYSYVYDVPPAAVREAARLRVAAMDASDRWVESGKDLADPLLAQESRLLVESYSALRAAIGNT